jgi:nitroreductase
VDVEHLLTATRSARKSLDLDAPVDPVDIRECLRLGLQAANGSNQQS